MSKDWIKSKEAELVTQAQDVSTKITDTPVAYGLVAGDATALATDVTNWVNKYNLATAPTARTKGTVEEKNFAKDTLVARMRSYGRRINAKPAVSNALKVGLGLNLRDSSPTPQARPS